MNNLKTKNTTYSASFTTATGGLFLREISALLPLLVSPDHKELLANEIRENRVLQINAQSTRNKVVNEINKRLSFAFPDFLDVFEFSPKPEKALLLFYLALKSEQLLYDFHFDVTIPAWKGSNRVFDPFKYNMKMDEIGNKDYSVREWAESTRKQILKIYKRMLKEAGFLKEDILIKPVFREGFFYPFIQNKELWFLEACFLSQTEREKVIIDHKG